MSKKQESKGLIMNLFLTIPKEEIAVRRLTALILILCLSLAVTGGTGAAITPQSAFIAPEVPALLQEQEYVDVLIKLKEQALLPSAPHKTDSQTEIQHRAALITALQSTAAKSQAPLHSELRRLERQGSIKNPQSLWIVNAISATISKNALNKLASLQTIEAITLDAPLSLPQGQVSSLTPPQIPWNLTRVGAPLVWDAYNITGEGIVIGIIDSGVHWSHPALKTQWRGYDPHNPDNPNPAGNWFDAAGQSSLPHDISPHSHGSHVLGTILGHDPGTNTFIGVAPGAKWIAANVFDEEGGKTSWALAAGQFMLAPNGDPALAPHIINNSWGSGSELNEWFRPMVQAWRAAGIIPVFAAGNSFPNTVTNPANYPESYAVAALDANNKRASFSCVGPGHYPNIVKPDISAPGVNILSATKEGYGTLQGTSMAAPHIAGIAALILSADSTLTPDQVIELINATATPLTDQHYPTSPNYGYGHGLANAYAAITQLNQQAKGLLTGTVKNKVTDLPLAATVTLVRGQYKLSAQTNPEGRYSLEAPEGDYTLHISAPGYFGQSQDITIQGHSTLDFFLTQLMGTPRQIRYDHNLPQQIAIASGTTKGFAVLMSPERSAYLESVSVYLSDSSFPSPGSNKFSVAIYEANQQTPGRQLIGPFQATGSRGQWNTVDISHYGITTSQDFFVVILMPGNFPNVPGICYDHQSPQNRSYLWENNIATPAPHLNYMIRSQVIYTPKEERIQRLSGSNRFQTAVEISKQGWESAETIILARGDNFADALAGVPLAHKYDAPILLTPTHQLQPETITEILRLGATQVIILGGTGAISETTEQKIRTYGITARRIGGTNRFQTAALIAQEITNPGTIILANGMSFPDALSVAPYAASLGYPILLTGPNTLPQETKEIIQHLNPNQTIVIGGSGVISDSILTHLPNPTRIAGANRYATNIQVANYFQPITDHAFIATGREFTDALTGAALAAKLNTGILLVDKNLPPDLTAYLDQSQLLYLTVLGGTGPVSEATAQNLRQHLK